jgi:lipoyl synthase
LLNDLKDASCDVVTIGQYLQPSPAHHKIEAFIAPEKFDQYKTYALEIGIPYIESAPLVRSSYHSEKHILKK